MRTPTTRRLLVALAATGLVVAGSGIAAADTSTSLPSEDRDWGIDFTTLERIAPSTVDASSGADSVLASLGIRATVDANAWFGNGGNRSKDRPGRGSDDKPGKGSGGQPPGQAGRFTVTTTNDTTDADPGDDRCEDADGDCSLRAAVQEANAGDDAARITLRRGATYVLDVSGADEDDAATGDLDVTGDLAITGDATIDASQLGDRALDVQVGASLALAGPDLLGGSPPEGSSGGAVRSAGHADLKKVDISGGEVVGSGASGGAVFNDGGHLAVKDSTFSDNAAARAGGAIEANAGTTELKDVRLSDNRTGAMPGNGGGLHLTGAGTIEVKDSIVTDNHATAEGGGLWNSGSGTMVVKDTRLAGNVASGDAADNGGGALFNDGGTMTVTGSTIVDNVADGASGSGGGILNNAGDLDVADTRIARNDASRAGGGIEAVIGTTHLDEVDLVANTTGAAPGNGGGLHLTGAGTVVVTASRVVGNVAAAEGGGLWNFGTGTMEVHDTVLRDNVASGDDPDQGGGGLFNDGGSMTVTGSSIVDNVADGASGSGGGILNNDGDLDVADTRIARNDSQRAGGGIEANVGSTDLARVALVENTTGDSPGNGGGLHLTGAGTVTIDASRVVDNVAGAEGGGLWNSATGTMTVTDTVVRRNRAPRNPDLHNDGGIFSVDGEPVPATP